MMKKIRGFTIVELQVASAIAAFMLIAVISLYIFYWKFFGIGNTVLDVYSNSRVAMGWLAKDIRCAAQVVPSHGSYVTSDSCVVLQVPSIDSAGSVIPSAYDYITYKLQGSTPKDLYRIVEPNAASSRQAANGHIAHYCDSLSFKFDGNSFGSTPNLSAVNTVSVYLPLNKVIFSWTGTGSGTASLNPTTTVRLRNK